MSSIYPLATELIFPTAYTTKEDGLWCGWIYGPVTRLQLLREMGSKRKSERLIRGASVIYMQGMRFHSLLFLPYKEGTEPGRWDAITGWTNPISTEKLEEESE